VSSDPAIALYDSLARWQWWRRRLSGARGNAGLEIRKRLSPPAGDGPSDGGEGLDRWLFDKLGERPHAQLLDLGCGFGASIQRWLDRGVQRAVGVTPSGYQVRRARQVAAARRGGGEAEFVQGAMHDALPAGNDVVLAIEALGHTARLADVLHNVRASLADGGAFLWVEDLLRAPLPDDADVAELARAWCSPPLRDVASARAALDDAGLAIVEEIDLTTQVPRRDPEAIAAAHERMRRRRWLLPPGMPRRLHAAFSGGLHLERLYARGAACYRFFMLEPMATS